MDKYIDTHCHIIHGVDDGSKSAEETREMLQRAYDSGTRCIIATPHHHPSRGQSDTSLIRKRIEEVREIAKTIDKNFRVYFGMEVFFNYDIPEKISKGVVRGINNKKYMLLEFSPSAKFSYIFQAVQLVQASGMEVIMAHCERYICLLENMEYIERLSRIGVRFQVNASSITGNGGRRAQKFIGRLMDADYVFCVGSDAHNNTTRPPVMDEAAMYVKKKYGKEYMDKIFYKNAAGLLRRKK